jgi:hypothetical protein
MIAMGSKRRGRRMSIEDKTQKCKKDVVAMQNLRARETQERYQQEYTAKLGKLINNNAKHEFDLKKKHVEEVEELKKKHVEEAEELKKKHAEEVAADEPAKEVVADEPAKEVAAPKEKTRGKTRGREGYRS